MVTPWRRATSQWASWAMCSWRLAAAPSWGISRAMIEAAGGRDGEPAGAAAPAPSNAVDTLVALVAGTAAGVLGREARALRLPRLSCSAVLDEVARSMPVRWAR